MPLSIAELARVAHPASRPRQRLMVLLRAYFDSSFTEDVRGRKQPGYVTSIGGYLGSEEAWVEVEKRWNATLKMWGLERFHLTTILAGRAGVSDPDLCVLTFAKIIHESDLHGLHSSIREDDWDATQKDPAYLERFPTHYHQCAWGLLEILLEHMALEFPEDRVAAVVDQDIQSDDAMDAIVSEWRRIKDQLASFVQGNRRDFPMIDCADLCAGQERIDFLAREFPQHHEYNAFVRRHMTAMGRRGRGVFWSFQTAKIIEDAMAELKRRKESREG